MKEVETELNYDLSSKKLSFMHVFKTIFVTYLET